MAKNIPGKKWSFAANSFMMFAAIGGTFFIRERLTRKKSHNTLGMVKVICCHLVLGRVLKAFLIQLSVAFLPHDEQNRDLQE